MHGLEQIERVVADRRWRQLVIADVAVDHNQARIHFAANARVDVLARSQGPPRGSGLRAGARVAGRRAGFEICVAAAGSTFGLATWVAATGCCGCGSWRFEGTPCCTGSSAVEELTEKPKARNCSDELWFGSACNRSHRRSLLTTIAFKALVNSLRLP